MVFRALAVAASIPKSVITSARHINCLGARVSLPSPRLFERSTQCSTQRWPRFRSKATAEAQEAAPARMITCKKDLYGGVIVDSDSLPLDEADFSSALQDSLQARPRGTYTLKAR